MWLYVNLIWEFGRNHNLKKSACKYFMSSQGVKVHEFKNCSKSNISLKTFRHLAHVFNSCSEWSKRHWWLCLIYCFNQINNELQSRPSKFRFSRQSSWWKILAKKVSDNQRNVEVKSFTSVSSSKYSQVAFDGPYICKMFVLFNWWFLNVQPGRETIVMWYDTCLPIYASLPRCATLPPCQAKSCAIYHYKGLCLTRPWFAFLLDKRLNDQLDLPGLTIQRKVNSRRPAKLVYVDTVKCNDQATEGVPKLSR